MADHYKCNACQNSVSKDTVVCSNSLCRSNLAICSFCRNISTYSLVKEHNSFFSRTIYCCDHCQNVGVKCMTWLSGGYCNGFARPGKIMDRPFCPSCSVKVSETVRSIVSWTIIGVVGALFRRK